MISDPEYFKKRRQERRKKYVAMLGGKCQRCGTTKNLQFDHIDPSTKEFQIGKIWDKNDADILPEVKKCQLLCDRCHREKTLENSEYGQESDHGTIWRYKKYKCRCDKCRAAMSQYYFAKIKSL